MLSFVAKPGLTGKSHLARCAARGLNTATSPPRRRAYFSAMPSALQHPKERHRWSQTLREERVMKCSNPHCNRGIGLLAHQRAWFDKRRSCSKECRNTFAAERLKMSQQKRSAATYVEWLFFLPVENSRPKSGRSALRRSWEVCYSNRFDARRDIVHLGGGRAAFDHQEKL